MILSDELKEDGDFFVSALRGGKIMREKRLRAITFAIVLCFLLAAPLFAANGGSSYQSADVFAVSSNGDYPTIDGEPLFTLHIAVAQESSLAIEIVNIISESLHDIGIEGVVHPLPFYAIARGLYPEDYGVAQYGFERPCPPGPPELVTVSVPKPIRFQHIQDEGVMWCGADDSGLATPPGYGNDWDERLTKSFTLPTDTAVLAYSIHYDTEADYDFVLVEISTDGLEWELLGYHTDVSAGFEEHSIDLTEFAGLTVQLRIRFLSDSFWSDEDGYYDSNGACRFDWVEVTGNPRDDFTTGNDGWVASNLPEEILVMQGYDISFHGTYFHEAYRSFDGFYYCGHSDGSSNQGYSNPVYDALWEELDTLPINWNANFPDPPDLDNPNGERALELLYDIQEIWAEDQPCLVVFNRMLWENGGGTGFTVSPWNLANEHLAIPEVRQAINLAMNRQAVLDLYGYEPPWEAVAVDSWLAPWHPGFNPVSFAEYNPERARQILFNAGYTNVLMRSVSMTYDIINEVQDLVDSGILKAGAGNSLTKKLESTIDHINRDNYHAASQKLDDFIDQINALIRSGKLPVEDGDELIALAQKIIDLLVVT